jgi:hypothetical protein
MPISVLAEPTTQFLPFAKGSGDPAFTHPIGQPLGTMGWTCVPASVTNADFLQYGPYTASLSTGTHTVHFRMAVTTVSNSSTNLVRLDVRENNGGTTLAGQNVAWNAFTTANQSQDFPLPFTNSTAGDPLEFRVFWNNASNAPRLTITDVTIDGAHNWTAPNLAHGFGQLDGLNGWEADPVRQTVSGYLVTGPGTSELPAGNYYALFELKVDNFNLDNAKVATLSVVNDDTGVTVATEDVTRNQFPNTLYQAFGLNFFANAGTHYDFRTFWHYATNAPRLTQRSVVVQAGTNSFFTGVQATNGAVILTFTGVPGRTYTVQRADTLRNPVWSNVGSGTVQATNGTAQFTDTNIGSASYRFYRTRYP